MNLRSGTPLFFPYFIRATPNHPSVVTDSPNQGVRIRLIANRPGAYKGPVTGGCGNWGLSRPFAPRGLPGEREIPALLIQD